MTVNRRTKSSKQDNKTKQDQENHLTSSHPNLSPGHGTGRNSSNESNGLTIPTTRHRRRSSLCEYLKRAKMEAGSVTAAAEPIKRIFKGRYGKFLALSLLLSLFFCVLYLSPLINGQKFTSFYQIKQYILNTYGTRSSKIVPEFPTRSSLTAGKRNHKRKELGHVPSRYLAQGKSKNAQILNQKLHEKSLANGEAFLEKIWSNYTIEHFKKYHLKPLLIERVSGTPGAEKAIDFIANALPDFYDIHYDVSKQKTALNDERVFKNIIASSNRFAERQMVVACHFDSKWWPNKNEVFIGAVDSAVPCAMMIQMAWNLNQKIKKSGNLGLQFYFFDGEEAFINWTREDSVYGSRNMVKSYSLLERTIANKKLGNRNMEKIRKIDRIQCFMLLDLLGNKPEPGRHMFVHDRKFSQANDLFERLSEIENLDFLKKKFKNKPRTSYFNSQTIGKTQLGIDDDHMPWYRAGVRNILHMIAYPFPRVWHTIHDNEANLDYDTIYNLQLIFDTFIVEYMRLLVP